MKYFFSVEDAVEGVPEEAVVAEGAAVVAAVIVAEEDVAGVVEEGD